MYFDVHSSGCKWPFVSCSKCSVGRSWHTRMRVLGKLPLRDTARQPPTKDGPGVPKRGWSGAAQLSPETSPQPAPKSRPGTCPTATCLPRGWMAVSGERPSELGEDAGRPGPQHPSRTVTRVTTARPARSPAPRASATRRARGSQGTRGRGSDPAPPRGRTPPPTPLRTNESAHRAVGRDGAMERSANGRRLTPRGASRGGARAMLRGAGRARGVGAGPVGGWGGACSAGLPPAEGGASSGGTPGGRAQPGSHRARRGRPADCGHGLKMREGRDTPAILASFVDAG